MKASPYSWQCGSTANRAFDLLRNGNPIKTFDDVDVDYIERELQSNGLAYVDLFNIDISEPEGPLVGFVHCFVLYINKGSVYRLESYVDTYPPRAVLWETYVDDLKSLLSKAPGTERLEYWNTLFSCDERIDTPSDLVFSIRISSGAESEGRSFTTSLQRN